MLSVSSTMLKKIKLLGIGFIIFISSKAQTENSPYSRYGLGDVVPSQNIIGRSMGGLAAAYFDYQSINFLNPASYSRLKVTTLDFGLELDNRTIRALNPPRKFSSSSPIISYVQLGVPLSAKKNVGLNFGLRPLTRINYKIERNERQPTKQIIKQVADFFKVDAKELQNDFLSDVIAYKILDEEADLSILKVAEEKVKYLKTVHNGK